MDRRITNFRRTHTASVEQKAAREMFANNMKQRLGNSPKGRSLYDMLIPEFPVGCRRQTPGPGYLEALLQENVETRFDDIAGFTEDGIRTKTGDELQFDVIVCATGFDTTFKPRFPVVGRNGVNLAHKWTNDEPMAYFGITVPDMPNYFSMSLSRRFIPIRTDVGSVHRPQLADFEWFTGTGDPDDGSVYLEMHRQDPVRMHKKPHNPGSSDKRLLHAYPEIPGANSLGRRVSQLV